MRLRDDIAAAPVELRPAVQMIVGAFGAELPDKHYYPLLVLLARRISFRQGVPARLVPLRYANIGHV